MPILATGPKAEAGFSLIELMVVVAIIATLTLAAVLSLRTPPEDTPALALARFERATGFLKDEAQFAARDLALGVSRTGWQSFVFDASRNDWAERPADHLHAAGFWGGELAPALVLEGRDVLVDQQAAPDIFILRTGEVSPFSLTLTAKDGRTARCTASDNAVSCTQGDRP